VARSLSNAPLVGVIMGSLTDYEVLLPGLDLLEHWGVPYEVLVASAHRTPERVSRWVAAGEARGLQVIIAAAGGAAHLPGVVAAQTVLPVIGVPIGSGEMRGLDALFSIVQMPPGVPVATVGINGAVNAATLALHILGRLDARWAEAVRRHRAAMAGKVDSQNAELRRRRPDAVWEDRPEGDVAETAAPPPDSPLTKAAAPGSASSVSTQTRAGWGARRVGRVVVESDAIPLEVTERAVECLREGGVVALPTDTVYGLAADAFNAEAVGRLFEIKGRDAERPVVLFIESPRSLTPLVGGLTVEVRRMLEAFWPGPLTVVFKRRGEELAHLGTGATLGVRLPDHSIPLTLMQELGRPIACTSANPSGEAAAVSGEEVEAYFDGEVEMIIDGGVLPPAPPSTVIDVSGEPWRILREGSISREQLMTIVGDRLAREEEVER